MPRKPLIYTHEFPYHITARSNNREWFSLTADQCWEVFAENLTKISVRFNFLIHSFVLMNNHYHLIGTCSEKHSLATVMNWFQSAITREINQRAHRINHVFGGRYKACIIQHSKYLFQAYKYNARNPVRAKIINLVEDYQYSSFYKFFGRNRNSNLNFPISDITDFWDPDIPKNPTELYKWLNEAPDEKLLKRVKTALGKTIYRYPIDRF